MRSFFWQIFLGFWLTAALVGLTIGVAAITLPRSAPLRRWNDISGTTLAVYAQSAAEMYEHSNKAGLNGYLERMSRTSGLRGEFFDSAGHPLSNVATLPAASALAYEAAARGQTAYRFSPALIEGAHLAIGPSGTRYVLVTGATGVGGSFGVALLIRIVAVLLITGFVCQRLAASFAAPVVALRRAAQRYAEGDLTIRVAATLNVRRDELGALGHDFDAMAARLEALALTQRQLLGDISHELRSPLARLQVALALAQRSSGNDDALGRIAREADRMDSLIGRLLTLARLESGFEDTKPSLVEIEHLVQDVAADADYEARSQDRRVECHVVSHIGEPVIIRGHADLLRSAVENVVRNGVRYTNPGTSVVVTVVSSSGEATITVRDHGPGVPGTALAEIFRPFRRVEEARERNTGGIGLGLAISERAVHLHGGTITATNEDGGGLCVKICLPLNAVSPNSNMISSLRPLLGNHQANWTE